MNKLLSRIKADSLKADWLPLRANYEDVVLATVATLWQRKLLIGTAIGVGLLLGITASLLIPPRYTANAFVRVAFASTDTASTTSGIAIDGSLMVETRSRVFKTHQVARRVVEKLGLQRLGPVVAQGLIGSMLQKLVIGSKPAPGYPEDLAATRLLRNLTIKTEPRVYLITVSYTAGDPELAALIVNAFVAESLRLYVLQGLNEQRTTAQAAVAEQVATLGERHPSVARARGKLASVEALLEAEKFNTKREIESFTNDGVIAAQPVAVPSSPNPQLIIGIAMLLGLVAGIGIAILLDRLDTSAPPPKSTLFVRRPDCVQGDVTQAGDGLAASKRSPRGNGGDVRTGRATVHRSDHDP
jgi:uncharacterized protein involved in exopolysaccharide biosynthesis